MAKNIFLLGGYDLEMETIRDLLIQYGQEYVDKRLSWGARLQEYISELREFGNDDEYKIYGIELDESGVEIPGNYFAIDHHNNRENEPSSLEQVCTLLGVEVDKRLHLIAANDSGYIPAMEKMGATKEEIDNIRRRDREAQGVTDEEEAKAEEAITTLERIGDVTFVYCPTNRFSPVVDRLYPYDNLVVYSESEFSFYGEKKEELFDKICQQFHDEFERLNFRMYSGGGPKGFFGLSGNTLDEIQLCGTIVEFMKTSEIKPPYSGHIFLFPFTWENTEAEDPIMGLQIVKKSGWKRVSLPDEKNEILYNELNYYYPFVHSTLYDNGDNKTIHLEQDIIPGEVKYLIETPDGSASSKTKTFSLDVQYINLNLYETGVGLLIIYTYNYSYYKKEDILLINQFGRRLFPPFLADTKYHSETPISIEIQGLKHELKAVFNDNTVQPNRLPLFLIQLVSEAVTGIKDLHSVLDDRMFVMSWYKSPFNFTKDIVFDSLVSGENDFLYKFFFVDGADASCQNTEMLKTLIKEAVYSRWQRRGTIYGVSRYSFQMLFAGDAPTHLIQTFETIYVRLLELVLVQRASILRFSRLLQDEESGFSQIYGQYINFLNKFRLPEVTAQDQGIELYDMLCERLRIREQSEHLDRQFNEREEFLDLQNEKQINEESRKLNILAGIAVPVSVISALFGFFFRDTFVPFPESDGGWLAGAIAAIASIAITLWAWRRINSSKRKRHTKH